MLAVLKHLGFRRKSPEEIFRENEERTRSIMNSALDAVIVSDIHGVVTEWNPQAEHIFGWTREEAIGQPMSALIVPEDLREAHRKGMERYLNTRQSRILNQRIEVPALHKSGTIFPVELTVTTQEQRHHTYFTAFARNITARKKAELRQQLLADAGRILGSSLDYEATLAAVCKLVVPQFADWCALDLLTEDKQIRRIETAHKDPLKVELAQEYHRRYPPQEGSGLMEVMRTGQPQLYTEITDEMLMKGARNPEHLEMMRSLNLKSVIMVPLVARLQTIGAMTLVSAESDHCYGQDDLRLALEIAARATLAVDNAKLFSEGRELAFKQEHTLQQYRTTQEQLSLLVEASGSLSASLELPAVLEAILNLSRRLIAADAYAVWRLDAASGIWSIGHSSSLSENYQQDSIRVATGISSVPDQPIIAEDALATSVLEDRKDIFRREGICSLMVVPLKAHEQFNGTLVFYYRTPHRFSDTEISVATALSNLAASAIRTAQLYEELKANDRKKDEFLAILAHELRNPLAPISNALEFMKSSSIPESRRAEAAVLVNRQIGQMTHLLNDLLDISRITRGKIELRLAPVDIFEAVTNAAEAVKPFITERGHRLEIAAPPVPIFVMGDVTRLSQVFTNLLNNAAKYTDPGGLISVMATREAGEVSICVKDNGIGIPARMLHSIFDMFAQVDSSMERSHGGLGIGLTLVKNIVEMHGGAIAAFSAGAGRGSEFAVRLPVLAEARTEPAASPVRAEAEARPLRVLVVDDNDASAKTMGWALEWIGHEVQLAYDGASALEAAKSFIPDAVLLDIGLPGMNGYDVCKAMRQLPGLQHTVFIAQTGWGQKEHRDRAKEAGFAHYLVKPVSMEALKEVLSVN